MTEQITTLDQLDPGQTGKIQKIVGERAVRRRLMDMGLTRGAQITVVKPSPFGDPIEYQVRGYHLSLRKAEAKMIEVTV